MLLAGCSGGSGEGGGGDEKVQLRFAWWGNDQRAATTRSILDDFTKLHPDITVSDEPVGTTDAYWTKLATSTAAGDTPDVITLGGEYSRQYTDKGVMLDLKTVKDQLDTSKFSKGDLATATIGDTLFGLPTGANALGLVINPAVFKAAGVALPDDKTWTWDDYVKIAGEITANSPEGTFGVEQATEDTLQLYAYQRGEPLFTEDGKLGVTAKTLEDYWDMTMELVGNKGMPSAELTNELTGAAPEQTLMGQGKAAMTFAPSNILEALSTASGADLQLVMPPGEHEYKQPGMTVQAAQYYGISKKSKHPKEAAMLIDYLVNSPEAGAKVLADRGLPLNSEVRESIVDKLPPLQAAGAAYINRIQEEGSPSVPLAPPGASQMEDVQRNLNSEVLFGTISPADAGKQFVNEVGKALG